jgi:hypothetical protein
MNFLSRKFLNNNLNYEVIDDFLGPNDLLTVTSENYALHQRASSNVFGELSSGKTTVKSLDFNDSLESPEIVLSALTSERIKNNVRKLLQINTEIYTLQDFCERGGHSFFHRMFPGSFLGLHVDRSYLPGTRMIKVANALLYTSKHWDMEHGGHLYLRGGICRSNVLVPYKPNRLVLLLHTSRTFHGVSQLSAASPVRYSAYMDFYVPFDVIRAHPIAKEIWLHETVYIPEVRRIGTFLRGFGYSRQLFEYSRRKRFSSEFG